MNTDFYYSQNSLGIYEYCPKKFEYIYLKKLSGLKDSLEVREKIEQGVKFHVLAERYFNGMDDYFYVNNQELEEWMKVLENNYLMDVECRSEYEIRQNNDDLKLLAKYDLILKDKDILKIIDFKTNEKVYKKEFIEKNIQTKVYMFLLGENIFKINPEIDLKNIVMEYFQLNFPEEKIVITYNKEKHEKVKKEIKNLINSIENSIKVGFEKRIGECKNCKFRSTCKK